MSSSLHPLSRDPQGLPAGRVLPPGTVVLAVLTMVLAVACTDDAPVTALPAASAGPATETAPASRLASASIDPAGEVCLRVADVEARLASLRAVELRLPNRVALDIELDKLQAAYTQLREVEFGDSEEILAGSLRRLGYRLGELELAVEDFRTNPRPRQAAEHVETDAQTVADELAAFVILSRC